MFVFGSKKDYDGWESLGNPGWGHDGLAKYFAKFHSYDKTDVHEDLQFMPIADVDKYHASKGPIHTSFNDWYMPLEVDFAKAAHEVTGTKKTIRDAWSGDHLGFYSSLGTVNRTDDRGKRSYSATGYLRPNLGRKNLKVLTEAQATKVLLEGNTAKGVEFVHNGTKHQVLADREVILSAGVIQSPQLLELSGIGDPEILRAAGVEVAVENKGVGANFQDHVLGGLLFDLKPGIDSMDALHGEEFNKMQQDAYEKTQKGPYGSPGMMMGFVSYASVASPEEVEATIKEIKQKSLAKTAFQKAQEKVSPLPLHQNPANSQRTPLTHVTGDRRPTPRPNFRQPPNILYPLPPRRRQGFRPNPILRRPTLRQTTSLPAHVSGTPSLPRYRAHHLRRPARRARNRPRVFPQRS